MSQVPENQTPDTQTLPRAPQEPAGGGRRPLSALDIVPVVTGASAARTLRNTVELAQRAEEFGYTRYWLAEHHNTPSIASSSPAVLGGQVAASTFTLRVGAGGVMLPNHPPLVVAEQFGALAALHPGRIDLGVGRAAGTEPATAAALRRSAAQTGPDSFRRQVTDVIGLLAGGALAGGQIPVRAYPHADAAPPVWLLGSSTNGARLAGELGLPFAFAHHFQPAGTVDALTAYRRSFRPSAGLEQPYGIVAALVIVADSDTEAWQLAASLEIAHLQLLTGSLGPYLSPGEADRSGYSTAQRRAARETFTPQLIGSPDTVRASAAALVEAAGADELMALTIVHDHAARLRPYELLAKIFLG